MPTKKTRRVRARRAATPGRNGNQQTETCALPQATQRFLHEWTPLWGPSLKSRVLSALGDTKARTQGELVKDLQDGVPDELALEGGNGKRGLVKLALLALANQGWIVRAGQSDSDRVRLVLPDPDPNFEIEPIFSTAVPAASAEEDAELEQDLLEHGCRDALLIWKYQGRTFLVDGHRRLTLCLRHRLPYRLEEIKLPDHEAVLKYVWKLSGGRRNLTPAAKWYRRGRLFNALKGQNGGDRRSKGSEFKNGTLIRAASELAKSLKVSRGTLFSDGRFAVALDHIRDVCGPKLPDAVLTGKVKMGRGKVELLARCEETEMKRLAAALLAGDKVSLRPPPKRKYLILPLDDSDKQLAILREGLGAEGLINLCKKGLHLAAS